MNKDGCHNKKCGMFTDMMPSAMNCAFNWIDGPKNGCDKYQTEHAKGSAEFAGCMAKTCEWTLSDTDHGVFETGCCTTFQLSEGTPEENNMMFCCYCGGKL